MRLTSSVRSSEALNVGDAFDRDGELLIESGNDFDACVPVYLTRGQAEALRRHLERVLAKDAKGE